MKTTLVIGVLAYNMICSISSTSTDCASRMDTCVSESDLCRSGWALLRNVCHVTDDSCMIVESEVCNMTIQYMLDQFPVWSGCLCLGKDYCSTPQLLAPQCLTHSGSHTSNRPPRWSQTRKEPDSDTGPISPQSCLSALQSCRETRHCWSTYKKLRDSCSPDKDQCGTPSSCWLLWGELTKTPMANCTCLPGKRRCERVWTLLMNNRCIHTTQEVLPSPVKGLHQREGNVDTSHATKSSCLQAMMVCVQDELCNGQLVPLVQACSASQCKGVLCGRATQQFYDSLPHDVAEMLVFCECTVTDHDCLQVKLDFQSGICFGQLDRLPTCLETHDICMEDPLCRQRYEKFWYKCFGEEEETLHHGYARGDCLGTLDPDLILGGNTECRRAFVGMMGAVIEQPCTCDGLETMDLYKCQKLHEVLHNRSIFISHLTKEVMLPHTTQVNGTRLEFQWFSDELFLCLVCILVAVIILTTVIMVLHKFGMCRVTEKAKFHPPPVGKDNFMIY